MLPILIYQHGSQLFFITLSENHGMRDLYFSGKEINKWIKVFQLILLQKQSLLKLFTTSPTVYYLLTQVIALLLLLFTIFYN